MEQNNNSVSKSTLELTMAFSERIIKRQWIAIILLIVLLVVSNTLWIWRDMQYEDVVTETIETSTEGGGNAYGTIVSGDNSEVNYGESQGNKD